MESISRATTRLPRTFALSHHQGIELIVSGVDGSDDRDIEQTNSKLTDGLKSCRLIMNNYKVLLSPEHGAATDAAPQIAGLEQANDP